MLLHLPLLQLEMALAALRYLWVEAYNSSARNLAGRGRLGGVSGGLLRKKLAHGGHVEGTEAKRRLHLAHGLLLAVDQASREVVARVVYHDLNHVILEEVLREV